jgi:hypothetical protein
MNKYFYLCHPFKPKEYLVNNWKLLIYKDLINKKHNYC